MCIRDSYRLTALIESPNLVSLQGLSIIKLDDVNINMNPIDVSKLMISTNRLMGSEKNNDSFNFLINKIQSRNNPTLANILAVSAGLSFQIIDFFLLGFAHSSIIWIIALYVLPLLFLLSASAFVEWPLANLKSYKPSVVCNLSRASH